MSVESLSLTASEAPQEGKTLKVLGWFSVGMAVAALGVYIGYELRSRHKFNQRTPYDFYSKAEPQATEFGVGI